MQSQSGGPQPPGQYQSVTWQKLGHTAGGERQAILPSPPDGTIELQENKFRAPTDSVLTASCIIIALYIIMR